MTTLILAAGEQTRWEKDHSVRFKQLLPVCGEPVLHRIVRQVNDRGGVPIIATHREELHCPGESHYLPHRHRWTVETLWHTYDMWFGDRVEILLGDTAYSRTVMDRIYACDDAIRVFGNEYEIYAISIDMLDTHYALKAKCRLMRALAMSLIHAMEGGKGTLRMFYEALCGFELGCGKTEDKIMDRVCYIQDYTKDFDTPNDYTNFLNRWERKGLVDDLP